MSRVVNPNNGGRQRSHLMKSIAMALRVMAEKREIDEEGRDIAAFLILALDEIWRSVNQSALAWEKRDYWVKADQFREQWRWVDRLAEQLKDALNSQSWDELVRGLTLLATKMGGVAIPKRMPTPRPWSGAWGQKGSQVDGS
ncbi:MAG: hypothetical protein ABSB61_00975 [Anaerolineales bacterium]